MLDISDSKDLDNSAKRWEGMVTADGLLDEYETMDTGSEIKSVANEGHDVCELELFSEKDIYFCGEVGCWTDSGRDSQW